MKTLKNDWLIWLIILSPLIPIIAYWDKFPEQIPTHFDGNGNPNDYSSKVFGLFLLPGINILIYFLFIVLPYIDPSRKNYALFSDKYKIIRITFHALITFVSFITSFYCLGYHYNLSVIITYAVLVLFLILGNNMGNIRHNYFLGIRTPWTLSNEEVWVKTHRLAAKLWVGATIIMMIVFPFLPESNFIFRTYVAIIVIIPIVYSYILFRKIQKQVKP